MKERTGTKSKGGGEGRCRQVDFHRGRVQLYRTQHEFYLNKHSIPYSKSYSTDYRTDYRT